MPLSCGVELGVARVFAASPAAKYWSANAAWLWAAPVCGGAVVMLLFSVAFGGILAPTVDPEAEAQA